MVCHSYHSYLETPFRYMYQSIYRKKGKISQICFKMIWVLEVRSRFIIFLSWVVEFHDIFPSICVYNRYFLWWQVLRIFLSKNIYACTGHLHIDGSARPIRAVIFIKFFSTYATCWLYPVSLNLLFWLQWQWTVAEKYGMYCGWEWEKTRFTY